jgi:hypothetical protein
MAAGPSHTNSDADTPTAVQCRLPKLQAARLEDLDLGWAGVAGLVVVGSFLGCGLGLAFDDAGVAAVAARAVAALEDLVEGVTDRDVQAARGKNPPG